MSMYQRIKLQGFLEESLYFPVFWIAFQTALRVVIVLAMVELLPLCQQTSLISYLFWSHTEKKWSSLQKALVFFVCVSFLPLTAHFPYLQAIIRSCIRSVWGELIWALFICCVSFVHTHTHSHSKGRHGLFRTHWCSCRQKHARGAFVETSCRCLPVHTERNKWCCVGGILKILNKNKAVLSKKMGCLLMVLHVQAPKEKQIISI